LTNHGLRLPHPLHFTQIRYKRQDLSTVSHALISLPGS